MTKDKQIEEMARISCDLCEYERSGKCTVNNSCGIGMCYMATHTARKLYNAGYRKQSEVAREIFDEIYDTCFDQYGYIDYAALAKLRDKYAE